MPALEEILQLPSGASWCKADLHVHTPASKDFYEDITPDDIVLTALSKGLDVMAVTDPNAAAWCDSVVNSAKGTPLTVFPGIEISTPQGHLIAIFDVDVPASDIEDMLALLIPRDQFASLETSSTQGIREVSSIIEAAGGISIAAHIDGKKGFWNTVTVANERKKVNSSPDVRCCEIVD